MSILMIRTRNIPEDPNGQDTNGQDTAAGHSVVDNGATDKSARHWPSKT